MRAMLLVGGGLAALGLVAVPLAGRAADAPVPAPGYAVSVFGAAPAGASRPDSLAMVGDHLWVSYGGKGKPDGSGGAQSQVVEFDASGKMLRDLTIAGHSDGLRLDPATGKLWSLQNEDGDANVVMIDPATGAMSAKYTFSANTHGGGYDDVAFIGGAAYVSASNPSTDNGAKNPGAAVVKAVVGPGQTITVTPAMPGTPQAHDIVTGKMDSLNLTDPDSLAISPAGDLILDSQGDAELLWMRMGAAKAPIRVLPLLGGVQVDDTVFVTASTGYLLVADTKADTVYKVTAPIWHVGNAYSASNGVDASTNPPSPAIPAYVGALDLRTGAVLPVVEHMVSPHGMIFVAAK